MNFYDIQSECMKKLTPLEKANPVRENSLTGLTYEKALFLIIGLLIFPSFVWADLSPEALAKGDDFTLSGYTEVGRKSTAEDYEEEDTDDDYAYQNYHLKLEQEVSDRLSYDISSFVYDKDYKDRDSLDNIFRIFKTNWSYYLKKLKEESFFSQKRSGDLLKSC